MLAHCLRLALCNLNLADKDSINTPDDQKRENNTPEEERYNTLMGTTDHTADTKGSKNELVDGVLKDEHASMNSKSLVDSKSDSDTKDKNGVQTRSSIVDLEKVTNIDEVRKACNETPTYEAWKTGQVPSPLKRGKSCKTPSPPPRPKQRSKAASVPTTSRRRSSSSTVSPPGICCLSSL